MKISEMRSQVLTSYLAECFGDMLVVMFGPPKPFVEAVARTQAVRGRMLGMLICGAVIPFHLSVMFGGHRFGVTPVGICLSVPHKDIPPTN